MKDEKKETAQALNLNGPRKHGKDGAGTRDTNPLYCGSYTIEDYERDRGTAAMTPVTLEFERFLLSPLEKGDPQEWERYRRIYEEARGEFEGLTASRYGYDMDRMRVHTRYITRNEQAWIYYLQYYELTDADLKADILEGLETLEGLISFADGLHDPIKEALEGSDWLQILEEKERMKAIKTPGYVPKVPTSEEFIQKLIEDNAAPYLEGWIPDAIEGEEDPETEAQPETFEALEATTIKTAAEAILGFELRTLRKILENEKKVLTARGETNKRLEELETEGYGPLIQFVKENYTEDRAKRFRTPDIGIYTLYVLMEYRALAGSPPEAVTADSETILEQVYQRIEGNAERIVPIIRKDQGEDPEGWTPDGGHTEDINELDLASSVPRFIPRDQIDPRKGLVVLRNEADRRLIEDPASSPGVTIRRNTRESVLAKISTVNGARKPSELDLDLTIQLGLYLWDMKKKGQEQKLISAEDLIRLFYGIPDGKRIKPERVQEMESTLENLTGVWITIDRDDIRGNPEEWGEEFRGLIGGRIQLLNYEEFHFRTAHGKKTKKFAFKDPPIWLLTDWVQLYQQTPMLIPTPDYPFDGEEWAGLDIPGDVRDRIIRHYQNEGLQMRRKGSGLQLQPYDTLGMKKWILRLLALKSSITRQLDPAIIEKMPHTVTVELVKAFREIHPKTKIPEDNRQFTVDFRMYLLYLMAWGYVKDYRITGAKTNPETIKIEYTERTRIEIAGVRNGVAELRCTITLYHCTESRNHCTESRNHCTESRNHCTESRNALIARALSFLGFLSLLRGGPAPPKSGPDPA